MRTLLAATLLAATIAGLLLAANASAAPTATSVRVADHPGFVRVVVEFSGGSVSERDAQLVRGFRIFRRGGAAIRVTRPGIDSTAPAVSAHGVRAEVVEGSGRIAIRITTGERRFKYVRYRAPASPRRLAIDLFKARPPGPGAAVRDDGCLRLETHTGTPGRIEARGTALVRLFENALIVRVRGAGGSALRTRGLITARGRWLATIGYSVGRRQRGTLEAVVLSAKDGALDCLVQVPVSLRPRA